MATNAQERRSKIERLRDQATSDGERQAAEAALERIAVVRPVYGTDAYTEAMQDHLALIGFCSVHRDVEGLSRAEVRTILNFVKYIGTPWEDTADELRAVARKIKGCIADEQLSS